MLQTTTGNSNDHESVAELHLIVSAHVLLRGNTKFFYPTVDDFASGTTTGDPTNYDLQNGRDSSGTTGINGPRWIFKLSGMYSLPWGMSASAFFNTREGIQFNRTILSPNRTGSLGTISVNVDPQGTLHLEAYRQLDALERRSASTGARSRSTSTPSICSTRQRS